jgi:hypothetical protein
MYILCNNISCATANDLRNYIQEKTGRKLWVRWNPRNRIPPLIRYGNTEGNYRRDTQYNSPEFINLCVNKLRTSRFLIEHNISSPVFINSITPNCRPVFPCLIRTTLTGHGGIGIHVITNEEQWNRTWRNGYWWTSFIRLSSEYRVIIFNGEPIRIFKKIREDGTDREDFPIRNNDNGYHFSYRSDTEAFPNLLSFIDTKLKSLIPIGFYGLDVGKIRDTEDFFVLELNSAPGLNTNTIAVLGDKLIDTLEL